MDVTPDTYWDLFYGYTAIWVCVVLYLLRVQQGQRKLANELSELRTTLSSQ